MDDPQVWCASLNKGADLRKKLDPSSISSDSYDYKHKLRAIFFHKSNRDNSLLSHFNQFNQTSAMTNENHNDECSNARVVSNDNIHVGTTEEVRAVSDDRAAADPTEATIAEAVAGVEIIDVDALSDDDSTAGATVATTK